GGLRDAAQPRPAPSLDARPADATSRPIRLGIAGAHGWLPRVAHARRPPGGTRDGSSHPERRHPAPRHRACAVATLRTQRTTMARVTRETAFAIAFAAE